MQKAQFYQVETSGKPPVPLLRIGVEFTPHCSKFATRHYLPLATTLDDHHETISLKDITVLVHSNFDHTRGFEVCY